jgi:hypothetical protein
MRLSDITKIVWPLSPTRTLLTLYVSHVFAYCTTRPTFGNGPVTGLVAPFLLIMYYRSLKPIRKDHYWRDRIRHDIAIALLVFMLGYTSARLYDGGFRLNKSIESSYADFFLLNTSLAFFLLPRIMTNKRRKMLPSRLEISLRAFQSSSADTLEAAS